MDDEWDKLLTGIPSETTDEDRINDLFSKPEDTVDLTS